MADNFENLYKYLKHSNTEGQLCNRLAIASTLALLDLDMEFSSYVFPNYNLMALGFKKENFDWSATLTDDKRNLLGTIENLENQLALSHIDKYCMHDRKFAGFSKIALSMFAKQRNLLINNLDAFQKWSNNLPAVADQLENLISLSDIDSFNTKVLGCILSDLEIFYCTPSKYPPEKVLLSFESQNESIFNNPSLIDTVLETKKLITEDKFKYINEDEENDNDLFDDGDDDSDNPSLE